MTNGNGNDAGDNWDEDDVTEVLLNPVYTMGRSPMVASEKWIGAQRKLLEEFGVDVYFERLLWVITQTFGEFVE